MKITVTKQESIARRGGRKSAGPNPFDDAIVTAKAEYLASKADPKASAVRLVDGVSNVKGTINLLRRAAATAEVGVLTEPVNETSFKFQVVERMKRKPKTEAVTEQVAA